MNFLPEDYESPKASNHYMKIQEGENRIRILTAPVLGWEDWQEKKPVRWKLENKPTKSFDPKKPVRHFWAFVVFNYIEERIQILQVTQATIRKSIEALCRDKDWGTPYHYDIKINKTGEGVDTEYTVNPVPHKPLDPYIISCFKEKRCNLEALYTNDDPFALSDKYAELAIEIETLTQPQNISGTKNIDELKKLFYECDPEYQKQLLTTLAKMPTPVKGIENVPASLYDKIKEAVLKKREEYQKLIHTNDELFAI